MLSDSSTPLQHWCRLCCTDAAKALHRCCKGVILKVQKPLHYIKTYARPYGSLRKTTRKFVRCCTEAYSENLAIAALPFK